MAELRDLRQGIDPTRGIERGLSIVRTARALKKEDINEQRAAEAFALNKKIEEQRLEADIQKEKDRQLNLKIDRTQGMWEIAHKSGNQQAKDMLRSELANLTGFHITADDEELGNLLAERRKAIKANDTEAVNDIDNYLLEVRSMSAEEAARVAGITSEIEALGTERKLGEELIAGERKFTQEKEQRIGLQSDIFEALKATDMTESEKTLTSMAGAGRISASILPVIMREDVTFRSGMQGTGTNKGKRVTKLFDKSGMPVKDEAGNEIEIPEHEPERPEKTSLTFEEDPLTGEKRGFLIKEVTDANGNVIGFKKLPEIVEEQQKRESPEIDVKTNFSFEEYKAMLKDADRLDPAELMKNYRILYDRGLLKRPVSGETATTKTKTTDKATEPEVDNSDKGLLKKMSSGFKGLIDITGRGFKDVSTGGERILTAKEKKRLFKNIGSKENRLINKILNSGLKSLNDLEKEQFEELIKSGK